MRSNRVILIIFTVVFLGAVIVNVIPSSNVANKNISVFCNNDRTEMIMTAYNGIKFDNTSVSVTSDEKVNSDVKLKYSSCISDEEQQRYNIYSVTKENLYTVTKKGDGIRLNYSEIKFFLSDKHNKFNDKIIVFTPNTASWFKKYEKSDIKSYVYKPVENIIGEDESVIAISFQSEISDLSKYDANIVYKDNKGVQDTFCILIKKNKFSKDDENKILSGLKKEITKLKGESNE